MTPFTPCNISYFHTGLELSSLPFLLFFGLLFEHAVGRKALSDLKVGCGCAVLQGVWVVSYTCYTCNREIHTCRYLQWSHQQHKLNDTFEIEKEVVKYIFHTYTRQYLQSHMFICVHIL